MKILIEKIIRSKKEKIKDLKISNKRKVITKKEFLNFNSVL